MNKIKEFWRNVPMWKKIYLAVTFCFLLFLVSCVMFDNDGHYIDDNKIEEEFEDIIEEHTGIEIDFSGESQEKDLPKSPL